MFRATTALKEMLVISSIKKKTPPPLGIDDPANIADLIEPHLQQRADEEMIVGDGASMTWGEFGSLSCRISNLLLDSGIKRGDTVSLDMENDPMFLVAMIGIVRIGAVVGLINTSLRGHQLVHCIGEVESKLLIVDRNGFDAVSDYQDVINEQLGGQLETWTCGVDLESVVVASNFRSLDTLLDSVADTAPVLDQPVLGGDRAQYVFTSGTTGLPKAAIITHKKYIEGARSASLQFFRARPKDRMYICLPLYHGSGLNVGVATCLHSGASMCLRKKFSATHFVEDVSTHRCNLFVYIGDICRYLMALPESSRDKSCSIERAVGNGLRPDIFKAFRKRFGIKRVCEFYSASESNGGFVNLFNRDETIGMSLNNLQLVEYNVEDAEPMRNSTGRLTPVADGDSGLLLFKVDQSAPFGGYKNATANEKKLVRNAFEEGDCWFNTGDLVREVDVGYCFGIKHYQFVDRLGDTFRWKSENVSTTEVAEILCGLSGIELAAVYGVPVPGADGKAGMATVALTDEGPEFDIESAGSFVSRNLAVFARPRFLRVKRSLETTGTHKILKAALVEQGYNPAGIDDPLYYLDVESSEYRQLDVPAYQKIVEGSIRL